MFKAGDSLASHFPRGAGGLALFPYSSLTLLDPASPQIRAVNTARMAVLPEETVVHKHSHTNTALGTYRNDNTGIVVVPQKRFKSLFALSEWSHWNVRNVFGKGRPRRL